MKKTNILMLALFAIMASCLTACDSGGSSGGSGPTITNGSYNLDQTGVTLTNGTIPGGGSCTGISAFTSDTGTGIIPIVATNGKLTPTESATILNMQGSSGTCLNFSQTDTQGGMTGTVQYIWNSCQYNENTGVLTAVQTLHVDLHSSAVEPASVDFTCNGAITLTFESGSSSAANGV